MPMLPRCRIFSALRARIFSILIILTEDDPVVA
jgi:hypothetical protein